MAAGAIAHATASAVLAAASAFRPEANPFCHAELVSAFMNMAHANDRTGQCSWIPAFAGMTGKRRETSVAPSPPGDHRSLSLVHECSFLGLRGVSRTVLKRKRDLGSGRARTRAAAAGHAYLRPRSARLTTPRG